MRPSTTPAPLKPAPVPTRHVRSPSPTRVLYEDRYVPEWFPADLRLSDLHERASARFYQFTKYCEISDLDKKKVFLRDYHDSLVDEDMDVEDIDSWSGNDNDSPPLPRKRVSRPKPTVLKKKNDNEKRARTLRRRQNNDYAKVYRVLEPLRHELDLEDRKFTLLLSRYKNELKQLRIQEAEDHNAAMK